MTLMEGVCRKNYRVTKVRVEGPLRDRLEALGLIPGTVVRVLNGKRDSAVTVWFRGSRFAVGSRIAEQIEVEELGKWEKK